MPSITRSTILDGDVREIFLICSNPSIVFVILTLLLGVDKLGWQK